jgi:hypothetical protein
MQHIKIFKAYYTTTKTHHNTLLVCNVEITLSTLYTIDECVWQCYGSKTTTLQFIEFQSLYTVHYKKNFETNRFVIMYSNNHMMTTFVAKGQHVYLLSLKIGLAQ